MRNSEIYIFIIANSLQARIAEAFCKSAAINENSVSIVLLRPVRWDHSSRWIFKHRYSRANRAIWRFMGFSINSWILFFKLRLFMREFKLIGPWHNEYIESLSGHNKCVGYFIEEEILVTGTLTLCFGGH